MSKSQVRCHLFVSSVCLEMLDFGFVNLARSRFNPKFYFRNSMT